MPASELSLCGSWDFVIYCEEWEAVSFGSLTGHHIMHKSFSALPTSLLNLYSFHHESEIFIPHRLMLMIYY